MSRSPATPENAREAVLSELRSAGYALLPPAKAAHRDGVDFVALVLVRRRGKRSGRKGGARYLGAHLPRARLSGA